MNNETAAAMTGTKVYHGAYAGTIQQLAYVRGLAHAAGKNGIKVFTQSNTHNGDNWIIQKAVGQLTANRLLIATDGCGEGVGQVCHTTVPYFYFSMSYKHLQSQCLSKILPKKNKAPETHIPS